MRVLKKRKIKNAFSHFPTVVGKWSVCTWSTDSYCLETVMILLRTGSWNEPAEEQVKNYWPFKEEGKETKQKELKD